MKYREIQSAHEESVLHSFTSYLKYQGITLSVVERPDPPDAVVKINDETCWIEITDAFQNQDWAKSITSYAATDKQHQPYIPRLIIDPDNQACEKVKEVILKKYNKNSMSELLNQYGSGILLVGAYTPITTLEEIIQLAQISILEEISRKSQIFKSIYLYSDNRSGREFLKLL